MQDGILFLDYTCGQVVRKVALAASVTAMAVHPGSSHAIVASCKHGLPGALSLLDLQSLSLESVEGAHGHLQMQGLLPMVRNGACVSVCLN